MAAFSTSTSPRWMPMRKRMRRSSGSERFSASSAFWISIAQRTEPTTLGNSASRLSPGASTRRPRKVSIRRAMRSRWDCSVRTVASSSSFMRRV